MNNIIIKENTDTIVRSKSRTKLFAVNLVSATILQIISVIVGFITPRFILQYYGSEINGLTTSILQFISYFTLVEAGLSGASIHALYKPLEKNDYNAVNSILTASRRFYIQAGYIFSVLVCVLALVYPALTEVTNQAGSIVLDKISVGLLVLVLSASGVLDFFVLSKYFVLLCAAQQVYIHSIATAIQVLLTTAIVVMCSVMRVNIVLMRVIVLLPIAVKTIIISSFIRKRYRYLNYHAKPNMDAMKERWNALYIQVLDVVIQSSPVVIATIILGDLTLISVYAVYQIITAGLNGVLEVFKSGIPASFGSVIASGDTRTLQSSHSEFEIMYYLILAVLYSCCAFGIMPFVSLYTRGLVDTAAYYVPTLGVMFTLKGLTENIMTPHRLLINSAGLFGKMRLQATIQCAIIVFGGVAGALLWGMPGILMSLILGNVFRTITLTYYMPTHVLHCSVRKEACRQFFAFGVVCIAIMISQELALFTTTYFGWAVNMCIVAFCVAGVVILVDLIVWPNETKNVYKRVIELLKEKMGKIAENADP